MGPRQVGHRQYFEIDLMFTYVFSLWACAHGKAKREMYILSLYQTKSSVTLFSHPSV